MSAYREILRESVETTFDLLGEAATVTSSGEQIETRVILRSGDEVPDRNRPHLVAVATTAQLMYAPVGTPARDDLIKTSRGEYKIDDVSQINDYYTKSIVRRVDE